MLTWILNNMTIKQLVCGPRSSNAKFSDWSEVDNNSKTRFLYSVLSHPRGLLKNLVIFPARYVQLCFEV